MRWRSKGRLALVVAVTAIAAMLPSAEAAVGDERADTLTGYVLLPDGRPAAAAVLDFTVETAIGLMEHVGRAVSSRDGSYLFRFDADRLGTLTELHGDTIRFQAKVTDLSRAVGDSAVTIATAVREGSAQLSRAVDESGRPTVAVVVPRPVADVWQVIDLTRGTAADLAAAAGVFNDPDLMTGQEDLDDPDVVPPFGSVLGVEPVTEADAADPASLGFSHPVSPLHDTGCVRRVETWLLPARGTKAPEGVAYDAVLQLLRCNDDDDGQRDYYGWAWDGKITNVDTQHLAYRIWRFKFRTELTSHQGYDFSKYAWIFTDPNENRLAGDDGEEQVHWSLAIGPVGGISGDYTITKAKKIHQWDDSSKRKLYHVSWISNTRSGSRGGWFRDGGGMSFVVPNNEPPHRIRTARNTIHTWLCYWPHRDDGSMGGGCDPQ